MKEVDTAAAYLREHLPFAPDLALVLGSGLGGLADEIEDAVVIPYRMYRAFPSPPPPATPAALWPDIWAARTCSACRAASTTMRATRCRP